MHRNLMTRRSGVRAFLFSYGFLLFMLMVLIFYSVAARGFLTLSNIMSILRTASPLLILASGVGMVIIAGKIDLSVSSIAYLTACIATMLMVQLHLPIIPSVLCALACAALFGMLNSCIVVFLRVSPLIATIGTGVAFRGLALQLSNAQTIGLPEPLRAFGNARVGPVFINIIFAFVVLTITHIVHSRTSFGRDITALGNGEEVAARLGIRVRRTTFLLFAISGLLAGLGGFFLMCQISALDSRLGSGMDFTAIASAIIGGISLFGGEGTIIPGLILGALTLTIIENGLNLLNASPFAYPFVRGAVIFLAMYADSLKYRVRTRRRMIDETLR